jgi:hypothetical protein
MAVSAYRDPVQNETPYWLKRPKTRDLFLLAKEVHY